ncbi:MAG: hypothetical protein V3S34_03860 [Hyphomicrobium sp.]
MRHRDSLMRFKRFRVQEFERRVATLGEMKADLRRKLADLDASIAREKLRVTDSDISRLAFPSFIQSIEGRRKNIRATMKELEHERAIVQDDLTAAYQHLKSFEAAEEERLRRIAEAQTRAAQSRVEHMALVRHLRKHTARP